jgi:hypothetical protein
MRFPKTASMVDFEADKTGILLDYSFALLDRESVRVERLLVYPSAPDKHFYISTKGS